MKKNNISKRYKLALSIWCSLALLIYALSSKNTLDVMASSIPNGSTRPLITTCRDTVVIGDYWQDDTNGDGVADEKDKKTPITWLVLERYNDGTALVLADKILDTHIYDSGKNVIDDKGNNAEDNSVIWKTSEVRTWLNNDFYNTAFTFEEKSAIVKSTLKNTSSDIGVNVDFSDTEDYIFLLAPNDMKNTSYGFNSEWYTVDRYRSAEVTSFANSKGVDIIGKAVGLKCGTWWLRTTNQSSKLVSYVDNDGYVETNRSGNYVFHENYGIRPAMRVKLSSQNVYECPHSVTDTVFETLQVQDPKYNQAHINQTICKKCKAVLNEQLEDHHPTYEYSCYSKNEYHKVHKVKVTCGDCDTYMKEYDEEHELEPTGVRREPSHTTSTFYAGYELYKCKKCEVAGKKMLIHHEHDYSKLIPETEPTETTNGMKAHYRCTTCKAYFDSNKKKVFRENLIIYREGSKGTDCDHYWSNPYTLQYFTKASVYKKWAVVNFSGMEDSVLFETTKTSIFDKEGSTDSVLLDVWTYPDIETGYSFFSYSSGIFDVIVKPCEYDEYAYRVCAKCKKQELLSIEHIDDDDILSVSENNLFDPNAPGYWTPPVPMEFKGEYPDYNKKTDKNLRYCFDNIITFPNGKTMEDIVAAEKKQQSNTEEKQQNNTEAPNKQSKQTNDKSTKTTNVDNGSGTISSDGKTLTEKDGTKYKVAGKITKKQLKKNLKIADKKSSGKYKITKVTKKNGKVTGGTVTYMKPYNKKCKTANIKATIKIAGVKFSVTKVANNAFKGCTKLTKVTIGKKIIQIGKNAFNGCKKLKTIIIKATNLKKIGTKAFKGIKAKASFKVASKKKFKKYKKMIKKADAPKKVKISKK